MRFDYPPLMSAQARATDIKAAVSRRLKAARTVVYDSAAKCAAELKLPKNTWQNYEAGNRYPDPYHLVRFLDATGFTADFIYRGRLRGIAEDVQIRLAADYPELVDEAPDVAHSSRVAVPA
jgi:transcriptional regulator with XRE-family HTH domain